MGTLEEIRRRRRQLRRLWAEGGSQRTLASVKRAIVNLLGPMTPPLEVRPIDVLAADLTVPRVWTSIPLDSDRRLVVNWVTTPPAEDSGGHTTMFRLIKHLEQGGHLCRIYLYDVYGGDAIYYESRIREYFPCFTGEVNDVGGGMADAHAVVATSWPTAYPVYNDPCRGTRFYLVQDFEPWFYPVGGRSVLAENTYRMGFHAVTAGRYLAAKLRAEYGMRADGFPFGCDTDKYNLLKDGSVRDGIVFYAKPHAPRRAFELGLMALQLFSKRHPGLKIHLYGERIGTLPFLSFPFIDHGVLSPNELNRIYNRCFAGLTLSMTNVSLVPHEMLSAGCIPVVNEATQNREVLENPFVRYAPPTPQALAEALADVVSIENFTDLATSASASVGSTSWEVAGSVVEKSILSALRI
jgi:hypothetical protein